MRNVRQVVDYALQRRAVLRRFRGGHVARDDVCDANPYLLRAAKFHGEPMGQDCPVCLKPEVFLTAWVFGDELGRVSGSARRPDEIERLANLFTEFTVYQVEVCLACEWNHLVTSFVLGKGGDSTATNEPQIPRQQQEAPRPITNPTRYPDKLPTPSNAPGQKAHQ